MADFMTERLDAMSRVTLDLQADARDQNAATRRRGTKPAPAKAQPEEPAEPRPNHEFDQMA